MNSERPLVSIVVPCYNAQPFIAETLQCLMEMSYQNWECVVVNDGSTDLSEKIVLDYCNSDKRFRYYTQPNSGPAVARNTAIGFSLGEYILPLDADDLISKTYIEEAVNVIHGNPNIKLVYCNVQKFGKVNKRWNLPDYSFQHLLRENMIVCTALYRRSDFNKTRGYDPALKLGREDWDFWLELLKSGGDVYKLDGVHFFYRIHKVSRDKKANQNLALIHKQIFENHHELYSDFIDNPIQMMAEYELYKKKYNKIRKLTFRKQIP